MTHSSYRGLKTFLVVGASLLPLLTPTAAVADEGADTTQAASDGARLGGFAGVHEGNARPRWRDNPVQGRTRN